MPSTATITFGLDVLRKASRIIAAQQQRLAGAGAVWQPGVREQLALDEVECWQIGYGLMRHSWRWASAKELETLAKLITELPLEAMPPSGGLWPLVARALAYGEPRQAAALVATLGKALRTFAVPLLKAGALSTGPSCPLAECTAALARQLLLDTVDWLEAAGVRGGPAAAAATAASPPQQQLVRLLLSCAVCEWHPPLCDLVSHYTTLMLSGQIDVQSAAYSRDVAAMSAFATLRNRWLPVLARRAERSEVEARAVPGCAAAGEGWRQLLLGSLGVVSALGASLAAAPRRGEGPHGARGFDSMGPLAEACCCVAAALPREVRAAAVEAGVRAAAVAGGGAAGSGAVGGPSGRARPGRGSGGPALLAAGWSLESARGLAAALRAKREEGTAVAAVALEAQLGQWVAGGGEEGSAGARSAVRALGRLPQIDRAARALPSDPADAQSMLRTCDNPACDNLSGESEADLTLLKCGGCSIVWYCRRGSVSILHGQLSKLERGNILEAFRRGTFRALVATDLGARGLDLPDCDAVINFGPPADALLYCHRAGRTGRAGAPGVVASVVTRTELPRLRAIADKLGLTLQAASVSHGAIAHGEVVSGGPKTGRRSAAPHPP
ncbi:DEAD-box ATP-dependent RNA helicase 47B [Tetrabaena socialis]|uniref:DEAD-box ATP-dependent RNA helicase 47B n=1 Tax=Tetrabaena socialis TaxID=47790 RepID=A0A2J8AFQ0_9CHLO|nr:DEAD-box ATP-dependent RNA helicase 47B [Tetrabaena socialis]|eukprot:PNH11347.1 DEAD-box ATP-dependent RNA helicase 47B [Tetrabaena socialis]